MTPLEAATLAYARDYVCEEFKAKGKACKVCKGATINVLTAAINALTDETAGKVHQESCGSGPTEARPYVERLQTALKKAMGV